MKNLKIILTTILFATLTGCVTGDDYNTPDLSGECVNLTADVNIQDVSNLATTNPELWDEVTNGGVLEAYVTSSDEGGNFYKSISMVAYDANNNEYGFTVPVNDYNLFNMYEPGRKVYIKMNGLYFMEDDYTDDLQVGALYGSNIGRIELEKYKSKILRSCEKKNEDELVHHITLAEASNVNYLHKLIEFDNVQFSNSALGSTYFDPNNTAGSGTNHSIVDQDGNSILLRTSEYANFAGESIPSGNGKIRGVLTKYGSTYQFMIRTLYDVKLTEPRIVPLFEESFDTNFSNWTNYSVSGSQQWYLATYGNPAPSAAMNGYSSGSNYANEDWLISPAIDLTNVSTATLTFQTASRYNGNILEVKISTDYAGSGNPNLATWSSLSATLDLNTGSFIWTNSGPIDLSSFTGNNVYLAFKYTSTTSAARTWEVDNIKIEE
ncbi:DUF5689 domain-containing protein [Flavobacterium sp. J27]|uniref:DUF5689 domain-containing protein n=1 Tax=Flavobacterium sp. J27 TaxID=2060419 RepID=UPI00102FE2FE|nr:DUF5689 domain-containing protein [Flavobacterium sp. J27]